MRCSCSTRRRTPKSYLNVVLSSMFVLCSPWLLSAHDIIYFNSKIFPSQPTELFHAAVRDHLLDELDGLDHSSVLTIKVLLKAGLSEKNNPDAVNLRESYAQAERFVTGIPVRRFGMISRKEIKHKL